MKTFVIAVAVSIAGLAGGAHAQAVGASASSNPFADPNRQLPPAMPAQAQKSPIAPVLPPPPIVNPMDQHDPFEQLSVQYIIGDEARLRGGSDRLYTVRNRIRTRVAGRWVWPVVANGMVIFYGDDFAGGARDAKSGAPKNEAGQPLWAGIVQIGEIAAQPAGNSAPVLIGSDMLSPSKRAIGSSSGTAGGNPAPAVR